MLPLAFTVSVCFPANFTHPSTSTHRRLHTLHPPPSTSENSASAATIPLNTQAPLQSTHHIRHLRRQKLSLLLSDLISRIQCELFPDAETATVLALLSLLRSLSTLLLAAPGNENKLRYNVRTLLWRIRESLHPFSPSRPLRTSLELTRSAFLDIPGRAPHANTARGGGEPVMRRDMHMLLSEIALLEELKWLRTLEREIQEMVGVTYPEMAISQLRAVAVAAGLLGMDDYRVRGKMRLAKAVLDLRQALMTASCEACVEREVDQRIFKLHGALVSGLESDLSAKRPAGLAMLLRPRMHDIPNFDVVNPGLLRGGQPSSMGLEWLVHYGVALVVDLRGSDQQNQWEIPKCGMLSVPDSDGSTRSNGIRFCNIAIEDFCTPSLEQVKEFISVVEAIQRGGASVFVHCKAGIGRTGTMIACWRIHHGEAVDVALSRESLYSEAGGGLTQETFVRQFAKLIKN